MKRMRQFLTTVCLVWIAACIAAYVYSHQQHISSTVALAVVPAFLFELAFYLFPGFAEARKWFDALGGKPLRAAILAASALIPYLIEALGTRTFRLFIFAKLLAMVCVAAFWYVWLRRAILADM